MPGPADEERQSAAFCDFSDCFRRIPFEMRHRAGLARIFDVDEVVTDLPALFFRRLCRADVHAAVDLAGVGRNYFAVELFGQAKRQPGFTGRRGADNGDHFIHAFSSPLYGCEAQAALMPSLGSGHVSASSAGFFAPAVRLW